MLSLSFAAPLADLSNVTDAEFLKALNWELTADAPLRDAASRGDVADFSRIWRGTRRADRSQKSSASGAERVLWSQQAYPEEAGIIRLIAQSMESPKPAADSSARRSVNKAPRSWAQRTSQTVSELSAAIQSVEVRPLALLAAIEFLTHAGHRLPTERFFPLWRQTLTKLLGWPLEPSTDPTVPEDIRLVEQGEIPFSGGLLYSQMSGASHLVKSGRKFLGKELVAQTDTDGTPHAELLARLPLWLAPFVRTTYLMGQFGRGEWSMDQRQLLSNVIDRAISLCRSDGRAALSNGFPIDSLPVLTDAAELFDVGLIGSTGEYLQAIQRAVAGKPPRRSRQEVSTMPSSQSDWARFALLRSDWSVEADSVAITHHQPLPQLDITALGRSLIHGEWSLKLKIGDAEVQLADEWSCVCWQSDPDIDYIELQMAGPGNLRVERLVLLSRTEHFVIVADAVSGVGLARPAQSPGSDADTLKNPTEKKKPGLARQRIEYESRLTLCEGMTGSCEGVTREAKITGQRIKARVFPLGLPQDRVQSTPHHISVVGNQLILKQVAEGEGLFAPMVLAWHPDRARVDATWRTLTVTEEGKVVGPDVAVGYRLKLDDYQLLMTRSLKNTGRSRACLGHHTFNETVIATFDSTGAVEPLLSVE